MHHDFLGSEGFQGTHIDALNLFNSKIGEIDPDGRFVNLFNKFSPLCGGGGGRYKNLVGTNKDERYSETLCTFSAQLRSGLESKTKFNQHLISICMYNDDDLISLRL